MKRYKEFGFLTMAFLVLLRLSIGWHFLFEGIHKIDSFVRGETTDARPGNPPISKPFSSAGYFREAPGPLAYEMRQIVGDPDDEALALLTVQPPPADPLKAEPNSRTPPALDKVWRDYLKQYADAHDLNERQRSEAEGRLIQNEAAVVQWLTMPWDPNLKREAPDDFDTVDEQLKKLNARQAQLTAADAAIGDPGENRAIQEDKKDIQDELKTVGSELEKLQALKKLQNRGFQAVEKPSPSGGTGTIKVLETPAERIDEYRNKVQEYRAMLDQADPTFGADVVGAKRLVAKGEAAAMRASLLADLDKKTADFKESLTSVLTPDQQKKDVALNQPLPLIWWIDGITAWALAIIGGCLLLGVLSRTNCVLAAGFLLMTYFIAPPWPWLPTPPNVEGNYLFDNKNVVEMFALLALATTASGRWFGVDALIHWTLVALFGRKKSQPAPARKAA